ncbi:hypothetical protein [Fusobacterium ulcerans]|uniref:hypothetical protein n=1 Tax=Fusobacterium ulcerans TaxID=861 RepID=UPI00309ABCD2
MRDIYDIKEKIRLVKIYLLKGYSIKMIEKEMSNKSILRMMQDHANKFKDIGFKK